MDIDAELRRQTLVSLAAVGLFSAVLVGIGVVYNGADGFSELGGLAVVGALAGFILLMTVVGFGLDRAGDDES